MSGFTAWSVDTALKEGFAEFCAVRGITVSSAVNMFAKSVAKSGDKNLILAMLDGAKLDGGKKSERVSVRMGGEILKPFSAACEDCGLPVAHVVRGFMSYCVRNNSFPQM